MKTSLHKTIKLPKTLAKLIYEEDKVFTGWIDSDFKNYGLHSDSLRNEVDIDIYTLEQNGTFKDIFESFDRPLDSLVVSQGQVVEFAKTLEGGDNFDYFFLLKEKEEFFVALVDFGDDGQLGVGVDRFSRGFVWDAGYRHRFVVPQLAPRTSETTLTPSSLVSQKLCQHYFRFLDYLGSKKNEGTFYCQHCLEIKKIKL